MTLEQILDTPSSADEIDAKPHIIFVDDDENILRGLRRMLKSMSAEWGMAYASSGQEALALMSRQPFDVIVSDMRMPQMDGVELLLKVKTLFPETVRIILSGYSEKESILRTVGPAHQYLAKPCSSDELIQTINRTINLRRFIELRKVRAIVAGLSSLPTPPDTYFRLIKEIESPTASSVSVTEAISNDIALTAEIMKISNSAYFSTPRKIDSLRHAISFLGIDTIKSIALSSGFFKMFSGSAATAALLERLNKRSIGIGLLSRQLAESDGCSSVFLDHTCSAGTLSHIGTLVLLARHFNQFETAINLVDSSQATLLDAESQVFGVAHPELGAYLLGLWGFVDPIVEAVAYHHSPWNVGVVEVTPLTYVYITQILTKTVTASPAHDTDNLFGLDHEYIHRLGIEARIPGWIEIVRTVKSVEVPIDA